jgi:hypothetical protein
MADKGGKARFHVPDAISAPPVCRAEIATAKPDSNKESRRAGKFPFLFPAFFIKKSLAHLASWRFNFLVSF